MRPKTKLEMKPGSSGSKKPKLYEVAAPVAGSTTTSASWPKRSKNTVPGCIVAMPIRGASPACANADWASSHSTAASSSRIPRRRGVRSGVIAVDADQQRMQAARVGPRDAEAEASQRQFLAGLGQVADGRRDQAADGVVLVVAKVRAEAFVEVGNRGQRVDHVLAVGLRGDQRAGVVRVVVLEIGRASCRTRV